MRTIAVDFDGVLHAYSSPWTTAVEITDGPVVDPWTGETAQEFVRRLQLCEWEVVVVSSRAATVEGASAIAEWLLKYAFPGPLTVTAVKPPALVYLDDRALRFEGEWPKAADLDAAAKPWNR